MIMRPDRVSVLVIIALSVFACTRDPKVLTDRHIALGDRYLAQKKYDDAALEYRIALSYSPRSGQAHLRLAEAYMKNDDLRNAYPEFLRAADSLPDDENVQLKAGNLLLLAGKYQEAKTRARAALKTNPKNVAALVLLGNSLAGLKDLESAIELSQQAAQLEPQRSGLYRNMGVFQMARGEVDLAEKAFKKALEVDPKSVSACLSLAELYRISGRANQVEAVLRQALAIDPRHVMANQAMASFFIRGERRREAEPYLKTAYEQAKTIETGLSLADYYLALGRRSDSVEVLKGILALKDGFASATTRLAGIEFSAGRRANAYKLLDDVLKLNPKHVPALAVKTRFYLTEGRTEEALKTITLAVSADQREAETYILLGKTHLARLEVDEAKTAFNEAVKLGSRNVEPQVELAKLHLQRGEVGTAIEFVEQAIETDPDNIDAQLTLVQGLIAQFEFGRARVILRNLLAKAPRAAQVHDMVGSLALAANDNAGARAAWQRALAIDPDNVDALAGIAALATLAKKPHEARALVEARLAKKPDRQPMLLLAGKLRMATGDFKGAESALKRAAEILPGDLQAYALLGQMFVGQKRIGDAKHEYAAVIKQRPRSVPAHTMMGLLAEAENDVPAAIEWYKKAVQIEWRSAAVAANNLAWLYASQETNTDLAIQLAESATAAMPGQPEFYDTLGWVYYKKQMSTMAIRALKRAVDLDPRNPVHQYHLGMAYALEGQDKIARRTLQIALRLSSDFQGADEARKVIATLLY